MQVGTETMPGKKRSSGITPLESSSWESYTIAGSTIQRNIMQPAPESCHRQLVVFSAGDPRLLMEFCNRP